MKVLVVSRSGLAYPEPTGGAEMAALRQALALAAAGAEVLLVGQGSLPGHGRQGRLELIDVGFRGSTTSRHKASYYLKVFGFAVAAGIRGAAVVRRDPTVEVVHCHHSATVCLLRRLAPRRALVYTVHDNPFDRRDRSPSVFEGIVRFTNNFLLERVAVRDADHAIAVSPEVRRRLEAWGVRPERITEILPVPAVPSEAREAVPESVERILSDREHPFLLSVGALTGRKRMDLLVEAMTDLPNELRLVVLGRGPARQDLERQVRALGLDQRVTILDYVSGAGLLALYRAAVACVLASDREGLPATLIEAVREGTPAMYVTTQEVELPATGPYLAHVVATSPAAVAEAVRSALSLVGKDRSVREAIRRWASQRFPGPDAAARQLLELYARLISVSRP